jgi:hypothetical protein
MPTQQQQLIMCALHPSAPASNRNKPKIQTHDTVSVPVESNEASPDLCSVLPLFTSPHFGLQGLACVAASSKQLKQICCDLAKQHALDLVVDTLKAAGEAATAAADEYLPPLVADDAVGCDDDPTEEKYKHEAVQQHLRGVEWLWQASPSVFTAAGTAERIVQTPRVPVSCALQLVRFGVRVPFPLIIAAASSMVAGVEVWVKVQRTLDDVFDIPDAAAEACSAYVSIPLVADAAAVVWFCPCHVHFIAPPGATVLNSESHQGFIRNLLPNGAVLAAMCTNSLWSAV